MSKLNLTEATMLALQGKLEESKPARQSRASRKPTKKQENIDINVDEKTAVSVMGNETIVDTEDATIIVDKKEDEFVPETSTDLPMEAPEEEEVVEVPVDGNETIIPEDEVPVEQLDELPVEQADEDEAVLDAEADVDLPLGGETEDDEDEDEDDEDKEESKKVTEAKECVEEDETIEIHNDPDMEVVINHFREMVLDKPTNTAAIKFLMKYDKDFDNWAKENKVKVNLKKENKSKKTETLGYHAGQCPDCKSDDLSFEEPNIYEDGMDYPFHCNSCGADGVERYNIDYVESETNELDESKKVESKKVKKEDFDENAYKSSNLFKALCDEITDIVVEDDEQPTQEQIETAVDVVINGYDYIWEDLHTALRTEIDKVTGKGDGDEYQPRYEAKSHRKSLGAVTEAKTVKYSSKSFKEALTKFYTSNSKTIESVELTKFDMTRNTIKMEAKLTNKDGMVATKKLEMKQIAQNKNFTKYSMQEVSKLKKENKSNITMLVYTNNNILECKYIRK